MIRASFLGTITVKAEIDENEKGLAPYGEIEINWKNIADTLQELIEDEIGPGITVSVTELDNRITKED